ncbi:hypothetical protein [Streptomyces sp. NBC_00306]|uniref:hypothetical protein n=1 Tax=Streptomyces sp. NBC_00306 TaxID=2975708 RepID=UPI002E2D7F56|nr:hypothetical protein [Streptomyces sp. NBC_00306]
MRTARHPAASLAACALALACATAGCSADGTSGGSGAPTTAPRASSAADICTSLVSYWAKETLKGSKAAGIDWEQKGLSNEQYAIHEEIVAAGRSEERRQGREKALALIDRQARECCAARNGATGSSENWRPPR